MKHFNINSIHLTQLSIHKWQIWKESRVNDFKLSLEINIIRFSILFYRWYFKRFHLLLSQSSCLHDSSLWCTHLFKVLFSIFKVLRKNVASAFKCHYCTSLEASRSVKDQRKPSIHFYMLSSNAKFEQWLKCLLTPWRRNCKIPTSWSEHST